MYAEKIPSRPGSRTRSRLAKLGLAGAFVAACLPAPAAAQDRTPAEDRECLTVELMMFSGRPRPAYLICEDAEKRSALELIAEADGEIAEASAYPSMPSDPSYQGIVLTLPSKGDERPARFLIRKGFLKRFGSDSHIRLDKSRKLERFFLKRSLREKDASHSIFKGSPLSDLAEPILGKVESEAAGQ